MGIARDEGKACFEAAGMAIADDEAYAARQKLGFRPVRIEGVVPDFASSSNQSIVRGRVLSRRDGHASVEAQKKMELATVLAEEIYEAGRTALEEIEGMPEEAENWLEHAVENAEFLVECAGEDGRIFFAGDGTAVAEGVLERATERGEELLLAAHDFARRMLDLDLYEWAERDLGSPRRRHLQRAVQVAERRMMEAES